MAWVYLVFAGLFEIGWPVGLKMAQQAETRISGILIAIAFMAVSGFCYGWPKKKYLLVHPMPCGQVLVPLVPFS
jgi:quaternary ammonium compound-resistance protein SugE